MTYTTSSGRTAKRVLMPKTRNHVCFEVDEVQGRVVVLAVWCAARAGPSPVADEDGEGESLATLGVKGGEKGWSRR